jgi:hypothetical protein
MKYEREHALKELKQALDEWGRDAGEWGKKRRGELPPVDLAVGDVEHVQAWSWAGDMKEGEYPGPLSMGDGEFAWLLKLKNSKWATVLGWHDYTGWDCQSGLEMKTFDTKWDAIRFGLTANARDLMGLTLPEESITK